MLFAGILSLFGAKAKIDVFPEERDMEEDMKERK